MTEEAAVQPENAQAAPEAEMTEEQMDAFFENQGDETSEEAPQEAPEGAPQEEESPEPEPEKTVPLAALHEERAKRKELNQKIQQMESRFQDMMDRLNKPEPEPELPSMEENPAGHLDARLARLEQWEKQQAEAQKAQQEQAKQHETWNNVMTRYQSAAQTFAKDTPDFNEAYQFWAQNRSDELLAAGFTEQQATHIMGQEEAAVVMKAFDDEANPAERMYQVAKKRGWKAQPRGEDGKFQAIEKGQKSKTLSKGAGSPPPANSLEALAAMDDEEFDKNWERIAGKV